MIDLEKPPKLEVSNRINKLYNAVNSQGKEWDAVFLFDRINHYYLTGTMQDGVFVLRKDGSHAYFVKRSYERAKLEALTDNVYPMDSYRDIAGVIGGDIHNIYTDTETVTYAIIERLKRYFDITAVYAADRLILKERAVKSEYELACARESGKLHQRLLDEVVPEMLREGMSEADFTASLYERMIGLGYHGVSRFAMFQIELVGGQIGFGENSLFPTCFNGPGGMKGLHPAVPFVGDRNRKLTNGDLVFVDIAFGFNGYHTDRTQIYMFGKKPPDELVNVHRECVKLQKETASLLKPGNKPSWIYDTVMGGIDRSFLTNFMGFGARSVKFLGHGIGLQVDEHPVISKGFDEPLAENMLLAIEPKKGVEGYGLVGAEDTYIVTKDGGECITGGEKDIIVV